MDPVSEKWRFRSHELGGAFEMWGNEAKVEAFDLLVRKRTVVGELFYSLIRNPGFRWQLSDRARVLFEREIDVLAESLEQTAEKIERHFQGRSNWIRKHTTRARVLRRAQGMLTFLSTHSLVSLGPDVG